MVLFLHFSPTVLAFGLLSNIIRVKPLCPSRKFVTFKLLHRWVPRLKRGTCMSEKIRRVSLTRFRLRRLCRFLSCSRCHSRPVNCAHALPLYCVQCYALPDPYASIAATATFPRHLQTVLCNSRSYNSRTLAGCLRCRVCGMHSTCTAHAQRLLFDVLIANSVSISLFSCSVHVVISTFSHFPLLTHLNSEFGQEFKKLIFGN